MVDPGPWVRDAACTGMHEIFDAAINEQGGHPCGKYRWAVAAAKRICRTCPVIIACRNHAIVNEPWGVWGGLTSYERGWGSGNDKGFRDARKSRTLIAADAR